MQEILINEFWRIKHHYDTHPVDATLSFHW